MKLLHLFIFEFGANATPGRITSLGRVGNDNGGRGYFIALVVFVKWASIVIRQVS